MVCRVAALRDLRMDLCHNDRHAVVEMVIEARALLADEPQRERTLVTVVHKGADLVRNHCHRAQQVPAAVIDDLAVVGQIAVKRHAAEHLLLLQLEAGSAEAT